jgi:hypothetical protein
MTDIGSPLIVARTLVAMFTVESPRRDPGHPRAQSHAEAAAAFAGPAHFCVPDAWMRVVGLGASSTSRVCRQLGLASGRRPVAVGPAARWLVMLHGDAARYMTHRRLSRWGDSRYTNDASPRLMVYSRMVLTFGAALAEDLASQPMVGHAARYSLALA